MQTLTDNIAWAKTEKRIFRKDTACWAVSSSSMHIVASVTLPLSSPSQLETQQYKPALALIDTLLTELKRLDDKMILTEVHLLESRVYRGIGNMAKAKVRHLHSSPVPFFRT